MRTSFEQSYNEDLHKPTNASTGKQSQTMCQSRKTSQSEVAGNSDDQPFSTARSNQPSTSGRTSGPKGIPEGDGSDGEWVKVEEEAM
jgi:hypothetical protein